MKQPYKAIWDRGEPIPTNIQRNQATNHSAQKTSAQKSWAPSFFAPLLNGQRFDFPRATKGKVTVLTFWASWCKPCLAEAPHLAKLHHRYHDRGAAVVAVSIDTADDHFKLAKVVANMALPYPVPLDPDGHIFASYAKGASIPLTLVIDPSGKIVYEHQNFLDGDQIKIEEVIHATLTNRSIPPSNKEGEKTPDEQRGEQRGEQ